MNGQHVVMFPDPSSRNDWVVARRLWWTRKTYAVSADGRVLKQRRNGRWREKRSSHSGRGYLQTTIDSRLERVNRLICRAYHGDPPPGYVAMHRDNNRANNDRNNLKWGSQRENTHQSQREGRHINAKRPAIPRGTRAAIKTKNGDWLN